MRVISEYDKNIPNLILPNEPRLENPVYSAFLRIKYMFAVMFMVTLKHLVRIKIAGWTDFMKNEYKDPLVVAIWHGSLPLPIIACHGLTEYTVMASASADGDLLLKMFKYFGYRTVRGSSNRRGIAGLLDHIRSVKKYKRGAAAVDGPKGPARVTKPGIVMLVRKTGAKVIAFGSAFSNCLTLKKSWDQARFPLPFSKAVQYISEPFELDEKMSVEEACRYINDKIVEAHEKAEKELENF